jgi:hypothetical protein
MVLGFVAAIAAMFSGVYYGLALMSVGSDADHLLRGYAFNPDWNIPNFYAMFDQAMSCALIFWVSYVYLGLYMIPRYKSEIAPNDLRTCYWIGFLPGASSLFGTLMFALFARYSIPNTIHNLLLASGVQLLGGLLIVVCLKWPNRVARPV